MFSNLLMAFDLCVSVVTALHPADALSTLRGKQEKVDLVVIDYHMPDMNGLELQEKVQNEFELPVISEFLYFFPLLFEMNPLFFLKIFSAFNFHFISYKSAC